MSKIQELLKQNGMQPKGNPNPTETPEEKLAREERERQQQGGGGAAETPEEKEAREKSEKEKQQQQQQGGGGAAETPEEKEAREKSEKEKQQQQPVIDDAAVVAYLKSKGKKVESLDDIDKPAAVVLTPEEEQAAAQQRQDAIRQFALKNKKVTSTDFDNYARETSIPVIDLAFKLFKDERIAELTKAKTPADKIPDDKALLDEFNETHFQYAAEDDPKRVRSEKLLQQNVDQYLESKYAAILDLEEEYDGHQQTTQKRESYGKVIDKVVTGLGTEMDFEIIVDKEKNEKFPFKFKITPEVQTAIKKSYMNDASFSLFGQGNVNEELLQQAIRGNIIQREFSNIISEGALAYASTLIDDKAKGRRGIPPNRNEGGGEGGEKRVNKVVQAILNNPENKKIVNS